MVIIMKSVSCKDIDMVTRIKLGTLRWAGHIGKRDQKHQGRTQKKKYTAVEHSMSQRTGEKTR